MGQMESTRTDKPQLPASVWAARQLQVARLMRYERNAVEKEAQVRMMSRVAGQRAEFLGLGVGLLGMGIAFKRKSRSPLPYIVSTVAALWSWGAAEKALYTDPAYTFMREVSTAPGMIGLNCRTLLRDGRVQKTVVEDWGGVMWDVFTLQHVVEKANIRWHDGTAYLTLKFWNKCITYACKIDRSTGTFYTATYEWYDSATLPLMILVAESSNLMLSHTTGPSHLWWRLYLSVHGNVLDLLRTRRTILSQLPQQSPPLYGKPPPYERKKGNDDEKK